MGLWLSNRSPRRQRAIAPEVTDATPGLRPFDASGRSGLHPIQARGVTALGECALVATGGAIGAVARYLVGLAVAARLGVTLPWGTFAVNVTGSFAAGLLLGLGDGRGLTTSLRLLVVTGFLGGYTTFSAFSVETMHLLEQQGAGVAAANVLGSVVLGLLAAAAGLAVGRAV